MATLLIEKNSLNVWTHTPSDFQPYILTQFYAKSNGDIFMVFEFSGVQRGSYHYSDISIKDGANPLETGFTSINQVMLRLEELKYVGFEFDGDVVPADLISTDPSNALIEGTDGKLFVPEVSGEVITTNTNITSSSLTTQDVSGFVAYINSLVSSFAVAANEIRTYTVTDTGQKFEILLRGRSFGGSEPDISTSDVLDIEKNTTEDLYRSWFSQTANNAGGLIALNTTTTLTVSGTNSVVARGGTTFYNSLIMNNYLSLAASGSNAGIKNTLNAEGYFLEGVDAYFVFANNDTATGCATAVGFYSLLAAIPNLDPTNFTANTILVGNDAGDTNLSFFVNRTAATPSFVKIPCGADFPAHTTSDAYLFRIEIPKTALQASRYAILTLTNIVTGKTFSTTVTGAQLPDTAMSFSSVINRSNRNTGVATNIRASKINVSRLLY